MLFVYSLDLPYPHTPYPYSITPLHFSSTITPLHFSSTRYRKSSHLYSYSNCINDYTIRYCASCKQWGTTSMPCNSDIDQYVIADVDHISWRLNITVVYHSYTQFAARWNNRAGRDCGAIRPPAKGLHGLIDRAVVAQLDSPTTYVVRSTEAIVNLVQIRKNSRICTEPLEYTLTRIKCN